MIKLEITGHTDADYNGGYLYHLNELVFSKKREQADFLLTRSRTFALEIKKSELYLLDPYRAVETIEKRKQEISSIVPGEVLDTGEFKLIVSAFEETPKQNLKKTLKENMDFIIENDPDLLKRIKEFRRQM